MGAYSPVRLNRLSIRAPLAQIYWRILPAVFLQHTELPAECKLYGSPGSGRELPINFRTENLNALLLGGGMVILISQNQLQTTTGL